MKEKHLGLKKIGITNMFMLAVLLILGILVISGGLAGVIAWVIIKFVLPFAGVAILFVTLVRLLITKKKRALLPTGISVLLCAVYFVPILLLMNVITLAYPANINTVKPSVTAQWPFKEKTVVGWGGDTIEKNLPHAAWGNERWAYDLVMEPSDSNASDLETYGIWNKEVFSPVRGTVIAVYDGEKDIPPNQDEFQSYAGNYVYIKIEETGTYLLLVHLKQGSVVVSAGDEVSPGDLLGRIGNSGTSSEPHLHIHHQRQDPTQTLYPLFAEGLPLYFENAENIKMPEKGMVITPVSHE